MVRWLRRAPWSDTLLLAWAGPYFAITGLLYARYTRYMMPLLPVLFVLAVLMMGADWSQRRLAVDDVAAMIGDWIFGAGDWGVGVCTDVCEDLW